MRAFRAVLALFVVGAVMGCAGHREEDSVSSQQDVTGAKVTREWASRLKFNFTAVSGTREALLREATKITIYERRSPTWNRALSAHSGTMLSNVDQAIASLKLVTDDEISFKKGSALVVALGQERDALDSKTVWGAQNAAIALRAVLTTALDEAISRLGIGDDAAQEKAFDDVSSAATQAATSAQAIVDLVDEWLSGSDTPATGADSRCGTVNPGEWCNVELAPTLVWRTAQTTETIFDGSKVNVCKDIGADFRFPTEGELSSAFPKLFGNPQLAALSRRVHYNHGPGYETHNSHVTLNTDGTTSTGAGQAQSIACVREPKIPRTSLAVISAPTVCGTVREGEFCDGTTAPTLVFRPVQSYETLFDGSKVNACSALGPGYRFPSAAELGPSLARVVGETSIAKLSRRVHYLFRPGSESHPSFLSLWDGGASSQGVGQPQSLVCVRAPE